MGYRTPICILALLLILGGLSVRAGAQEPSHEPDAGAARHSTTRIDAVRFVGAKAVSAVDLTAAISPWLHRDLSFDQMREMAGAITALYRRRGYMVASAYLPAQTVHDNVLTITVAEGKIGAVWVRSNKTKVGDDQIRTTLAVNLCPPVGDCAAAETIREDQVERAALLVNAIPGVAAKYQLAPGAETGTTDLLLDATTTDNLAVTLGADNNGFAFTGRRRASLAVAASNLFGRGDLISLNATYTGKGFLAFAADASLPFGYRGARLGATGGHLRYALGGPFAILNATGVSDQIGFYGSYPLARSLRRSVDLRADLLAKAIRSEIGTLGLGSTQSAVELMISVSGSQLDRVFHSASTQYRFAYTAGELRLGDPANRAFDAATAGTNGSFGKFSYLLQREELLEPGWTIFARISGQYATTNLDSSEKFALGGSQAVRAYDTGAAAADIATLLTVETRLRAPASLTGPWELIVAPFYDRAWLTLNKQRWASFLGPNKGQMAGYGIYGSLSKPGRYSLRATWARRVRTSHDIVPGGDDRAWLEAAALF